jgi:hypothetical protein
LPSIYDQSVRPRPGPYHTRHFASIAAAVAKLSARSLVLDGEVAIYDEKLRSRFDWLREPDPDAVATPPLLMAFDLLHQDGREIGLAARSREAYRAGVAVAANDSAGALANVGSTASTALGTRSAAIRFHEFPGPVDRNQVPLRRL